MLTIPSPQPAIAPDLRQRLEMAYQDHALQSYLAGQTIPLPHEPYRDWETDRKSTRLNSSH